MTKEKVLLFLIAISMLVIAILPTTVQATEEQEEKWTDLSNAKIEIIGESTDKNLSIEDATFITYKVKISNVILNPEREYRVYFHYKDEEITKDKVLYNHDALIEKGNTEATINSVRIDCFLQKNEDIYVSVLETEKEEGEIHYKTNLAVTTRKIQRPELLPKLGNRFHIHFSFNSTRTYFWAPNNTKTGGQLDRTLKIKVGKITDIEILKTIKENKAKGLQQLLSYAKKVTDYNYVGNIEYNHNGKLAITGITESLTSKMNLTDGEYYFAYIELDDENGVYYPVKDIALYRAKGTTDLVRYSDKEFVWEIVEEPKQPTEEEPKPEEPKKEEEPKQEQPEKKIENVIENTIGDTTNNTEKVSDSTTAKGSLPQTGESAILLIVVLLAGLAGIGYVKYKKYQDIK